MEIRCLVSARILRHHGHLLDTGNFLDIGYFFCIYRFFKARSFLNDRPWGSGDTVYIV